MIKKLFLSFAISLHCLTLVLCKNCVQIDQCKCAFDDGSGTVDISPISQKNDTPLIRNEFAPDNYAYSYNPCYPFTMGTCTNCAACQYDATNVYYYNIGDAKKVQFSYDGTNVVAKYVSDDDVRTSIVTFVCDPSADPATYSVQGETAVATYEFTITSKHACASVTTTPTTHMTTSPPTSINPNTKPRCKRKTDCSCLFNDGTGEMDLSGLGRTDGTPLINNVFAPDGFGYSFNPCYAFNLEKCTNAAVCRFDSASKTYKNIGSSSGVEYLYDGNNVVGTYTSSDGKTKTMVTFICDLHVLIPFYDVIGEVTAGTYNITIKTNRVCPSICGAKPGWNLVG